MKHIIYLIVIIGIFASCNSNTDTVIISKTEYNQLKGIPNPPKPEYPKIIQVNDGHNNPQMNVLLVDSCEYFTYYLTSTFGFMCHKGNCKFCQQRLEQTIRKIIQEELKK